MMRYAVLYKKTSNGAIQQWQVAVEGATIVTTYGQVGGKLMTTRDSIKEGKNQGRKNETDRESQAMKEAQSQWVKKKKAGYTESLEDADSGKTDKIIEGGIEPMSANSFDKRKEKVIYPVLVQPKFDGHRCIAVIDLSYHVTLWSRQRRPITSAPHIQEMLSEMAMATGQSDIILDGELYNHKLRHDFEKITSLAKQKMPDKDYKMLQYHIYDLVRPHSYVSRWGFLKIFVEKCPDKSVQVAETFNARNENEVRSLYGDFVERGYEGAMVRQNSGGYLHKRCDQLLKVKEFEEDEFEIIGMEEGRGKLQGHAGNFVCKIGEDQFSVKMSGETKNLKKYWENQENYIGQMVTVKYQGFSKLGIPRFPVGLRIREDL